ncbi:MAG: hypothetical protein ACPGIJ_08230, partial [Mycobacterium sp.]
GWPTVGHTPGQGSRRGMGRTIAESKEIQDSAPVTESSDGPRGAAAMEGPEDNAVPAAET